MSYLESEDVQAWLKDTKFQISSVKSTMEVYARDSIFGKLGQRYDTSGWTDKASTPELIISVMAMLVASAELRQTISEDAGEATYPDWLEKRAMTICDDMLSGAIVLDDLVVDETSTLGGGPLFFPTDAAAERYKDDPTDESAAIAAFSMSLEF